MAPSLALAEMLKRPDFYIDPESTEYITAGHVTFGIEYRLLHVRRPDGYPTEVVKDHGVCIHVIEGKPDKPQQESLRFDCFLIGPHYHYMDWVNDKHENLRIDTAANGDAFQWVLGCIKVRLAAMLMRAGAYELASKIDQREIDAVLPKLSAWAEILKQRVCANWQGHVNMTGAQGT